jgi:hypothetical protein
LKLIGLQSENREKIQESLLLKMQQNEIKVGKDI